MDTLYATSPDLIRIAYELHGTGPAIILLHGGGGSRQEWFTGGYVERLMHDFTVIPVDLRGHGESDKPTAVSDYSSEKMKQDLLAVADACGVEDFILCGYSLGGNVARYLAASSARVSRLIMIGNPLGPGTSGEWRQMALDFCARWGPVVSTQNGVFDPRLLSPQDHEDMRGLSFSGELIPSILAMSTAMLEWPVVGPTDIRCPALWLIGSENQAAMGSWQEYTEEFTNSQMISMIFGGFDHQQEFEAIDLVLPGITAFARPG